MAKTAPPPVDIAEQVAAHAPAPVATPKATQAPQTQPRDPANRKQWKRDRAKALGHLKP